jgi:heme/copper-type cytochrome/quinol oxidase subunit 1
VYPPFVRGIAHAEESTELAIFSLHIAEEYSIPEAVNFIST